jgi:peptide maturation system protein (TIGR04066 family)
MLKKERILLYPYDYNQCPIVRHSYLLNSFSISSVVSPHGWGLTGLDAGCIDGGAPIHLTISDDFNEMLELCDTVVLTDSIKRLDFKSIVYPKVLLAVEKQKNIIALCSIEDTSFDIEQLCLNSHVYYKQLTQKAHIHMYFNNMHRINIPIIFVLGVSERTNKFEIQLSLRESLINEGYRVSQIGTKNFCEFLGFHSFPDFMYSVSISETQKVKAFNNFVKEIEVSESPDVIIIGIPGSIMKLNDYITNDFGILAYEISQAVKPDAVVLSMLYEDYPSGFSDYISNEVKFKFGFEIDCFNIANVKLEWEHLRATKEIKFVTLESELINSKIIELNKKEQPIYNILNKEDADNIAEYLIDKLACSEFEAI